MPEPAFSIIGHRGDGAGPDENTLASCQRAIAAGADAVEVDVMLYRGELVLAHGRPSGRSERLSDLLDALNLPVMLHLKRRWFQKHHDVRALGLISALRYPPGLFVASFWPSTIAFAIKRYPDLQAAFISFRTHRTVSFLNRVGVTRLCVRHGTVSQTLAEQAKQNHVKLYAYTPNRPRAELGGQVAGVITDNVSGWRRVVPRARRSKASGTRRA